MTQSRHVIPSRGRFTDQEYQSESGSDRTILFAIAAVVVVVLVLLAGAVLMYNSAYVDRVYQGVSVLGIDLGGDAEATARARLSARIDQYARTPLSLRYAGNEWKATPAEIGLRFDAARTVSAALEVGREGNPIQRLLSQLVIWRNGRAPVQAFLTVDTTQREAFLARLARQIDQTAVDARLIIQPDFKVRVAPSQTGRNLDVAKMAQLLDQTFLSLSGTSIDVPVQETPPKIADAAVQEAKATAEKMLSAPITFSYEDRTWAIQPKDIQNMIVFNEQKDAQNRVKLIANLSDEKLKASLAQVARDIDRKPLNARFNYGGGKLTLLRESIDGRLLDVAAAVELAKSQAITDRRTVALPVSITKPAVTSADAGKLTIKEMIDTNSTSYAGSIPERKNNVELAAKRLNGVVVGSGEIFSFNNELGPATLDAGFKTAWGIEMRDGNMRTVPAEAGGICQVATTLFQPVFWAGYQLEERYWHLYWIPKYGKQPKGLRGLDATVDAPYVDLKFKNNTSYPILIQSRTDGSNISFSLYGVKPGWHVKVEEPKIENVVKTITETVKEEDPNMPFGQTLMVEEAQDGFKSTIVRTVTEIDDIRVLRLISDYKPSRNVVRVGTKGAPPPSQPQAPDQKPDPRATPTPPPPDPKPDPRATPTPQPPRR